MRKTVTIGIDEVGRGALAGPVVLAAVYHQGRMNWRHQELGRIRDSKKLTPRRREIWFRHLASHPRISWQVVRVSPTVIDRINIARAANLGAHRLVKRLSANYELRTNIRMTRGARHEIRMVRHGSPPAFEKDSLFADGHRRILLDGGLSIPSYIPHRAIVKGDEKVPLIAAASIMAKVWRDRLMTRLGGQFPEYGFEAHKGYGTEFHRRMIRRHGPSEIHRRTFIF